MSDGEQLKQFIDVRDLGPKGYEIVVTLVNEGEEIAVIRGVMVEALKDEVSCGRHRVIFPGRHEAEAIELGQFEIAEGHFHLAADTRVKELHFRVDIDFRCGDRGDTRRISRRMKTAKFGKGK